ncbi:hypothetical protein TNCV_3549461 [Trichonephila clavipes]|nr:hypothetical protein TNCV_3549461 [Trichonephila clavipes]
MIASRNVRKIWKRVVLYHVLKELTLPTGLCFPAKQRRSRRKECKSAHWNEKENGDYKTELAAGTSVELKQEPALITDPNSDVGKCI